MEVLELHQVTDDCVSRLCHEKQALHIIFLNLFLLLTWNNNNDLFYIAPQQQLYDLLALRKLTTVIEHTSVCYLN